MNLWAMLAMLMQPVSQLHADQTTNNGYTLTVWASPDLVSQYNGSVIYAQLTDPDGAAVEGATLNFNAASGDGSLGTYSSTTDSNGQCAVGYQAGGSSAQINVFDGNGFGLSTSCVVNVLQPPQPPNYQLWISSDKNPLINGETTNVNVCIMDVTTWSGLNGATVYFTVSSNDAVLGALSATTDANGNCSVPVTAGSSTSQISAWSYPSSGGTLSNSFLLQCPSSGDAYNLDVSAEQAAVPQNGSTTLHSSISDTTLGLPMSGTQVVFSIQSGDGRLIDTSGNSTAQVTTYADQNGNSALSFWSGTQPTTITVTATNGTITQTQTLTVGVLADNTYHLNLWSSQSMLKCGEQATLTAQLINDTLGIPVSGSQLYFQITNGDGNLSSYQSYYASTDSNGVCNIAFTGGNYSSTVSVCDLSGYSTYQNTSIGVYTTNPTCSLTLSAGNNVLLSGASTVLHTQFWDSTTGLPISGGAINFAVSTGDGGLTTDMGYTTMPNFTAYSDANGNCDLYFVGGTMPSYVTATAADYQQLSTGYPFGVIPDTYIMYLSPSQVTLPVGGTTTFTAQLYNVTRSAYMTNTPVLFTVNGGDASIGSDGRSYSATTDSYGYANVSVTNGSIASTITVTDQVGYGASASGVIYPPANYSLTMSADRTKLMHNHSSPIHLLLTDISTRPPTPVPYTTLTLYLSGEGGSYNVTTGSDGRATATYVMGAQSETVTASATDNEGHSTTNSIPFTLAPAPSYSLSVTVPPDEASLQAGQSAMLTATFLDETPLPIPRANVTWEVRPDPNGDNTGLGSVAGAGATDKDGNATALFTFGSKPTVVDVTASIWNKDYSVTITSTAAITLTPLPPPCICGCTTCADVNGCSNGSCLPCMCKFANDPNTPCSCASVGGCNNDCRSCQCVEVGDNCTCANDAGCMSGDCGPCDCGTTGCDCSRKSADCNGGCMDCKCGGYACHCETPNACNGNSGGCSGGGGDSKDTGLSITVDVGSMTATLRAGSDSGQINVSSVLANGTSLPVTKAIMDPGESQTVAFTMSDIAPWPASGANFIAYYIMDNDNSKTFMAEYSLVPIDLAIVHPATGELEEAREDVGDGGYVSVQRLEDNKDVAPKTKLLIHAISGAPSSLKTRLKFNNADRYKIYQDEARTQEVVSEQTEFPANTDNTLYFHGLKKSLSRGGETVTIQVSNNGQWSDGDSVKCTIVQSEFLFQVKAFIPYAWTETESEDFSTWPGNLLKGKVPKGDLHSFSSPSVNKRAAFAPSGFTNAYSTDAETGPSYALFDNAPFRVCQTVIITPYEELHSTGDIQGKRKLMTAPLSEHYFKSTSVDSSEMSLHMGFKDLNSAGFSNSGKPPPDSDKYEHLSRSGRIAELTVDGGGKDGAMPYGTTWATNDIHWRLYIKVWADGNPLMPRVEFGGQHRSYPAYEIIVNQSDGTYKDIHRVLPVSGLRPGPGSLSSSRDIKVGRTDTITK